MFVRQKEHKSDSLTITMAYLRSENHKVRIGQPGNVTEESR